MWLGYYNGAVDGDFGKRTRDAILTFQTSVERGRRRRAVG